MIESADYTMTRRDLDVCWVSKKTYKSAYTSITYLNTNNLAWPCPVSEVIMRPVISFFSEMAAESLGGSHRNCEQLMGHPLHSLLEKKTLTGLGKVNNRRHIIYKQIEQHRAQNSPLGRTRRNLPFYIISAPWRTWGSNGDVLCCITKMLCFCLLCKAE